MNRQGVFWQRVYFDRIIRSESDLFEKWNCIRTNPVRKGLAHRLEADAPLFDAPWLLVECFFSLSEVGALPLLQFHNNEYGE